jgi:hypothetical protein
VIRSVARAEADVDRYFPFDLHVDTVAAFANAELVDDPIYDGFEVQWFDDPVHGTGLLAFLQRRDTRRVDFYVQPGLTLDRAAFELGGGTGGWFETVFESGHLVVDGDGVEADVRFADIDGRQIEIRIDDRDAGPRNAGGLLAPVSAAVDHPTSLLLVYVHDFDLVRRGRTAPIVRIDGVDASTGRLPGARWHRRHLVKAGATLSVTTLCRAEDGDLAPIDLTAEDVTVDDRGVHRRAVSHLGASAELRFHPPVPWLTALSEGDRLSGGWEVAVDGVVLTGGRWGLARGDDQVDARLLVTRRWTPPAGQPILMRVVTRVVPTFRRWPTTYRWWGSIALSDPPRIRSRWERTTNDRGAAYRAATTR